MSDYQVIGETPSQQQRPRISVTPSNMPAPSAGGTDYETIKNQMQSPPSNYEVISETPSQAQPDVQKQGEQLYQQSMKLLEEKDKTINYDKGARYSTQVLLQRTDNPDEAALQLEKIYGKGNYGQDTKGGWWVKEDGKQVSVFRGGIKGSFEQFGTGMVAQAPMTAGAATGAAIGGLVGGGVGAIPGAMIGAATAKGLEDLTKWAEGVFSQKPSSVASHMLNEGSIAALFQAAPGTLRYGYNALKRGIQLWTDVTEETAKRAQSLGAAGARPPIKSYAPGATAMELDRRIKNILSGGDSTAAYNISYVDRRLREIFASDGMSQPEIGSLMSDIYHTSSATSTTLAGEKLVASAQKINRDAFMEYEAIRNNVEQVIRADERALRGMVQAPMSLGSEIAANITQRRRDFGRLMGDIYRHIDNFNGDRMVVPMQGIHDAARDLVDVMPPGSVPPVIARFADPTILQQQASGVARMTFQQAHALRTVLREMGDFVDIRAAGIRPRNAREMANAVDAAMDMSMGSMGQQQAQELRRADEMYRAGIRVFDDATIKKLAKLDKAGLPPEPGVVVNYFMSEDNPALADHVVNNPSVTPQLRSQIIQADLGNMLQKASIRGADGQLKLDGKMFLDQLDTRHRLLAVTYPPNLLNHMRTLARDIAAFDGQIDVTRVQNPTQLMQELQRAIGTRRAAEEYVKTSGFQALLDGTPAQVDAAVGRFTTPGDEAQTEAGARALGIDSPAWNSVRRYAMRKLFTDALYEIPVIGKTPAELPKKARPATLFRAARAAEPPSQAPAGKTISSQLTTKRLYSYTARQQELLFPHGIQKDIEFLAKEIKFLFPHEPSDFYQSLSAGSIREHLPQIHSIYRYLRARVLGMFVDSPQLMRFLTSEIKRSPTRGRGILSLLVQTAISRGMGGGPGKGAPTLSKVSPSTKNQQKVPAGAGIYGDTE